MVVIFSASSVRFFTLNTEESPEIVSPLVPWPVSAACALKHTGYASRWISSNLKDRISKFRMVAGRRQRISFSIYLSFAFEANYCCGLRMVVKLREAFGHSNSRK